MSTPRGSRPGAGRPAGERPPGGRSDDRRADDRRREDRRADDRRRADRRADDEGAGDGRAGAERGRGGRLSGWLTDGRRGRTVALAVLALTVAQLLVATLVPGLDRFEGKAFAARLVAYPLMMLLVPAFYLAHRRRNDDGTPLPWGPFALLMLPFAIDVTGNTLDLYDAVGWWDDANHFVNWFLLALGAGLLLAAVPVTPRWALGVLVAGVGALLAVGWELAEYWTFIRGGTELDTAYTDTLGDEVLGCLGAAIAGFVIFRRAGDRAR